jgi:hypothetical protein
VRHWLGGKDKLDFLFKTEPDDERGAAMAYAVPPQVFEVANASLQTAFRWLREIQGYHLCLHRRC